MSAGVKRVLLTSGLLLFTICAVLYTQEQNRMVTMPYNVVQFFQDQTSVWDKGILEHRYKDTECHPKELSYLNASHPNFKSQVCLVSFPGSGNTWARHLIQEATGFYTGSVYTDNMLAKGGFPGEKKKMAAGDCIVYKSHLIGSKGIDKCQKIVLLMRNPFDAFVAFFHFSKSKGSANRHTFRLDADAFKAPAWNKFVKQKIFKWERLVSDCTNVFQGPLHLVFYEELKNDVMRAMADVVEFLKLQPNIQDIWCMYKNGEGQHHRKSNGSKPRDIYSETEVEQIKTSIMDVAAMIKKRLPERNLDTLLQYSNQYSD